MYIYQTADWFPLPFLTGCNAWAGSAFMAKAHAPAPAARVHPAGIRSPGANGTSARHLCIIRQCGNLTHHALRAAGGAHAANSRAPLDCSVLSPGRKTAIGHCRPGHGPELPSPPGTCIPAVAMATLALDCIARHQAIFSVAACTAASQGLATLTMRAVPRRASHRRGRLGSMKRAVSRRRPRGSARPDRHRLHHPSGP
jgi:hypothetical protein